ncbi:MAG: aldehyde dehydrogenase family protein [Ectothiorhodospiraceae bacterium]|nr:aldehyde dehydrogenase family protein [Planctomycetota bacterium]MCP5152416.1 aldehyde dehydrogenase family protein [Chromatiales bacterium]MCP5154264.1 aldehyde dehydrogenase family protein [Ectothiorhodospiraceae bacterium]
MTDKVRCVSPVDGSVYAERPRATDAEVAATLDRARAAQRAWRQTTIADRAEACSRAVDAMLAMREAIVPELAWQMGRPVRYGAGELNGFQERARHMIGIAADALAPVDPGPKDGFVRYVRRDPLGLVLTIAPWNYPYLTAVNSVVPALMAGNAVILKHAAQTLLVAERFQAAMDEAGLPAGLFQHLFLSHDQTTRIIASGAVDHVCFTGSVEGGRAMERAAAGTFTGLGLELGGKDPAYVRGDADLAHAVENLVDGSFFNSGQSCCGIERIYVDANVHDAFVERFVDLTRQYVLGSPLESETTLGPMVRPAAAEFVREQVAAAVRAGATAHVDPRSFERDAPGSAYMAPQVLTGVDHQMSVMREESFGPVVGIMPVASEDEAVALMNDSPYGLTASIWTRDLEAAERIGTHIETGTVFMNRCDYLDPALAWTGVKDTGRGATLSRVGYEMLTRPKSFHLRR